MPTEYKIKPIIETIQTDRPIKMVLSCSETRREDHDIESPRFKSER